MLNRCQSLSWPCLFVFSLAPSFTSPPHPWGTLSVDLSLGSRPGSHEAPAQARLTWLGPDRPRPLLTGSRRLTHPLSCCLRHTSRARLPLQPLRAACLTHECPATPPSGPLACTAQAHGLARSALGRARTAPSPHRLPLHTLSVCPLSLPRAPPFSSLAALLCVACRTMFHFRPQTLTRALCLGLGPHSHSRTHTRKARSLKRS